MWWKLGILGALVLPPVVCCILNRIGEATKDLDRAVSEGFFESVPLVVLFSFPLGFLIGSVIGYFLQQ